MRIKSTFVVLLLAIVATTAVPATGQEEPLPAIQPKRFFEPVTPEVFLAVDPIHATVQPTLADAVRANDYAAFEALYRDSLRRGMSLGAYETLHEIWTYSITDPIGAFYGPDLYERLSRAYPGFARYIDDYRIVDSNGNVFYPTSETRAFLLDRAIEGARGVKVQVAATRADRTRVTERSAAIEAASPSARTERPTHTAAKLAVQHFAAHRSTRAAATPKTDAARRSVKAREHARASAPTTPVQTTVAPVVIEATPKATPAPSQASTPAQAATSTQAASPAPAPIVVKTEQPLAPIKPADNPGSRGILLLVVGLIGIGLLAMMLRAPREVPSSIMAPPDKVEPLRKPVPAPPEATTEPTPSAKNRANGSRG